MKLDLPKYKREYCCDECGLIWFGENGNNVSCKECGNKEGIYACDTFGYAYASQGIKERLELDGKEIHYDKEHPYYNRG